MTANVCLRSCTGGRAPPAAGDAGLPEVPAEVPVDVQKGQRGRPRRRGSTIPSPAARPLRDSRPASRSAPETGTCRSLPPLASRICITPAPVSTLRAHSWGSDARRPPPGKAQSPHRGRPLHPGDHLVPAVRPRRPVTTSASATTRHAPTPTGKSVTTSARSRPSASKSPSPRPPDPHHPDQARSPRQARVRCRAPSRGELFSGQPPMPLRAAPYRRENSRWYCP